MKTLKKTLCLVLAVVMVVGVLVLPAGAADTVDYEAKYEEALQVLKGIGLLNGKEDGKLHPEQTLTRAEAATVIARMLQGDNVAIDYPTDNLAFADTVGHWGAPYVAFCQDEGIIGGYEDGTFRPDAEVTGYEFAKMVLVALGQDESAFEGNGWEANVYAAMREAKLNDGITGINWTNAMKRGEVAQMALNGLLYTDGDAKIYTVFEDKDGDKKYTEGSNDVFIWQGSDYDEAMLYAQSANATVESAKDTEGSLANEVYDNLHKEDTGVYDGFGRPSVLWTNNAEDEIYMYAKKANRTYNGTFTQDNFDKLTGYEVYYNNDVADPEFHPYIEGAKSADGVDLKINGNGIPGYEVEIYTAEKRIIVREAYLANVEASGDDFTVTGYVRTDAGTTEFAITVTEDDDVYEDLTVGYAAIYFKSGAAEEQTADYILEVAALDEVKTEKINLVKEGGYAFNTTVHTDKTGENKGYGLNYMFMVLKKDATEIEQRYPGLGDSKIYFYNGNILFIDQSTEVEVPVITDSYAYLWDSKLIATYGNANGGNQDWESGDGFTGKDSSGVDTITAVEVRVRLVFADGTATSDEGVKVKTINGKEVKIDKEIKDKTTYESEVVAHLGKLVYYTKNADNTYNLITIDPETTAEITAKKSEGTVGSEKVAFDSKTVFMVAHVETEAEELTDVTDITNYLVDETVEFYDIYEITQVLADSGAFYTAVQPVANFAPAPTAGTGFVVGAEAKEGARTDIPRVVLILVAEEAEEEEEDPGDVYFIVDNINAPVHYTYAEDGVKEIWYKELLGVVNGEIKTVKVAIKIDGEDKEIKFNSNGTLLTIDPERNNGIIVDADPAEHNEVTAVGACVNMRIDITTDASEDMVNYLVNTELAGDRAFEYNVEDGTIKPIDLEKLDKAAADKYKAGHAVINGTLDYLFVTTVESTDCDLEIPTADDAG